MKCDRCKSDFPTTSMRVDAKGQRLICENCHTYIRTGMLVPETKIEEAEKKFEEVRRKLALTTVERLELTGGKNDKYECKSCDYKFSSVQNYKGKCPYCGEESVAQFIPETHVKEIDEFV